MHEPRADSGAGASSYDDLVRELEALLEGEHDLVANAANCAAFLYHALSEVNWVGFYFLRGGELVVGPFQGKPACTRIALGKGVCGTAAATRATQLVPDVHAFPGHIACDSASRSELVVPLSRSGELLGVLDIDSPRRGRFTQHDRLGVEALARAFVASLEVSSAADEARSAGRMQGPGTEA
jgi:GAF domain-containing protein